MDLKELRDDLRRAEREVNQLEGREEALEQELEKYDCSNLREANKKYKKLQEEFEEKKEKHEKEKKEIIEKYNIINKEDRQCQLNH